jgi:hypothetical protein
MGLLKYFVLLGVHFLIYDHIIYIHIHGGWGSVGGIATRCRLHEPVLESRWGLNFPLPSRPSLGHPQSHIK